MSIPQGVEKRIQECLGSFCSSLHLSIVKLFISPTGDTEDVWRDPKIIGYLTLFVSRKLKTTAIRIYDMQTFDILFETELYYNFKPIFSDSEHRILILPHEIGSICFVFCDSMQGSDFINKIEGASQKLVNETYLNEEKKSHKKKGGFFSFFKKNNKKQKDVSTMITGPSHFEHVQHWDKDPMNPQSSSFVPPTLPTSSDVNTSTTHTKNTKNQHKKDENNSLSYLVTQQDWDDYMTSIDFAKSPVSTNRTSISFDHKLHIKLPTWYCRAYN